MSVRAGNNPFDATSGAAKRAADTVSDKAKSFWNDEVLGAKKAMERDASKNPGEDVRATVDVTLEQSVLGAEVPLTYSRRRVCPGCGGAGRYRRRSSTATRARGTGAPSPRTSP